ncbi:MAG TPA: NADH-quinone oxidoreductase subunit A [Candidatus Kapabacteria bacterium]|jgi:NADH-quinone oxidoreductase subunit A|nr:NADH-quinone oxidoreductase subunit A [Candidatus Kapabacteria bacterium]HOV92772.1 NADH-quinone oxidoreductase subunit A [Candidatus Kapabacteria bacterium]
MYLTGFGIVLIFFIVGALFVGLALFVSAIIRPSHPTDEKLMTYESGEVPIGTPWVQLNPRFYIIGLAYLIFDVEVVLLFPWAVVNGSFGWYAFWVMVAFVVILILGLVYDWAKGYLEWDKPNPEIPVLDRLVIKRKKETQDINKV